MWDEFHHFVAQLSNLVGRHIESVDFETQAAHQLWEPFVGHSIGRQETLLNQLGFLQAWTQGCYVLVSQIVVAEVHNVEVPLEFHQTQSQRQQF